MVVGTSLTELMVSLRENPGLICAMTIRKVVGKHIVHSGLYSQYSPVQRRYEAPTDLGFRNFTGFCAELVGG